MGYAAFERLCKMNGIRPSDVAKATGIASATLSAWKHGAYTPKNEKMEKIAQYFDVPLWYLNDSESVQTNEQKKPYYLNEETAKLAEDIYANSDLGLLFQASRNLSPEDLRTLQTLAKALMEKERNE